MPRARTLKPSFFSNVDLADMSPFHRLLFAGLWCWADRDGRLEDRPKQIKGNIFPFDEGLDVDMMLTELQEHGFVTRYVSEGKSVIEIPNFEKHQNPHPKEAYSDLPPRKEISLHGKTKVSGLSSVSFPSVTSPLSPDNADLGESLQLDLEDSITTFISNAYRRNGRPRPKLTRRQDQPLVERIEESERKHSPAFFRECLLNYLDQESEWLRTNEWPLNRFLQDPESYAVRIPRPEPTNEPQRVPEPGKGPGVQRVEPAATANVTRNFLSEWNLAVPEAFTEFEPKSQTAITPEFVAKFEEVCEVSKAFIKNKPDSTWLDFYWVIATKKEHTRPNWKRLITTMRGMAYPDGQAAAKLDDAPWSRERRIRVGTKHESADRKKLMAFIMAEAAKGENGRQIKDSMDRKDVEPNARVQ